ncbi:hypothetical protein EMMF5_005653 [Cystobasidiomycetes sp. EMM_F5]
MTSPSARLTPYPNEHNPYSQTQPRKPSVVSVTSDINSASAKAESRVTATGSQTHLLGVKEAQSGGRSRSTGTSFKNSVLALLPLQWRRRPRAGDARKIASSAMSTGMSFGRKALVRNDAVAHQEWFRKHGKQIAQDKRKIQYLQEILNDSSRKLSDTEQAGMQAELQKTEARLMEAEKQHGDGSQFKLAQPSSEQQTGSFGAVSAKLDAFSRRVAIAEHERKYAKTQGHQQFRVYPENALKAELDVSRMQRQNHAAGEDHRNGQPIMRLEEASHVVAKHKRDAAMILDNNQSFTYRKLLHQMEHLHEQLTAAQRNRKVSATEYNRLWDDFFRCKHRMEKISSKIERTEVTATKSQSRW